MLPTSAIHYLNRYNSDWKTNNAESDGASSSLEQTPRDRKSWNENAIAKLLSEYKYDDIRWRVPKDHQAEIISGKQNFVQRSKPPPKTRDREPHMTNKVPKKIKLGSQRCSWKTGTVENKYHLNVCTWILQIEKTPAIRCYCKTWYYFWRNCKFL